MLTMEWKIGEIKQINGEWYQCMKELGCDNCDLIGPLGESYLMKRCSEEDIFKLESNI